MEIDLPQGWRWEKLGQLVDNPKQDIVDGPFGSNLKSDEYIEEGIPVFKIQNIKVNRFVDKKISYISQEKAKKLSRHSFCAGDLIITKLGEPLGLCCKVPEKYPFGIIVADLMRLRPSKTKVYDKYLIYAINSKIVQDQFKTITKGTTRARVNLSIVRDIQLPIPSLDEQHILVDKVEELFSELDKGIENLKIAQQQLKVYRQAVLKWAFEGKLTNENVKDGELPEEWKLSKIQEVANVGTGATPLKSNNTYYENGNIAWITSGALNDDFVDQASDFVTAKALKETNLRIYPKHTLLLAMYGEGKTRGKCSESRIEATTNQAIAAIYFEGFDATIKPYLKYFLLKNYNDIRRQSSGGVQPNINLGIVKNLTFPLAPPSEQQKIIQEIESRLSVCDKMEETIANSLQQAEALRQSILKRAFEGKLVKNEEIKIVHLNALINSEEEKDWQRKALAGKIIEICHDDNNFGHTKFQKTLHLCEYHAQLDFNANYVKEAAGPFDQNFFFPLIEEAKINNWFYEKPKRKVIFFEPGSNITSLTSSYSDYFKDKDDKIQFVINQLKDKDTFQSELISTIYAIWNNYLIKKEDLSSHQLIAEVYDWSKSKLKFSESDIVEMWKWMKETDFSPVGFGNFITNKGN